MGIFSKGSKDEIKALLFNRITTEENNYLQFARDINETDALFVDELYGMVYQMVDSMSERELSKAVKTNGLTVEETTINIIQNVAMMYVAENSTPVTAMMFPDKNVEIAKSVYKFSNDEKYRRGFISKRQYEENERVLQSVELGVPYI